RVSGAPTARVEVCTSGAGGEARALVVSGGPAEAVAALGHSEHRLGRVTPASGLARVASARATGGGARWAPRGAAPVGGCGRGGPGSARAGLVGPPDPAALGAALDRLTWWVWD